MRNIQKFSRTLLFAMAGAAAVVSLGSARATDLNPAAIKIQLPDQIKWVDDMKRGESSAILAGDPEMPGIYVELVKWHAHHMSRPHFHPNDRFITVISGTWWVGTGSKYDPESTVPIPTGAMSGMSANKSTTTAPRMRTWFWKLWAKGPRRPLPRK